MTERSGEALDVALGLLRAPALRGALRARPLPGGVAEVLAIASGSADRTRAAAERTGYTEADLVEAARFYVQQVLLVQGVDAYRTLGTDPGADHATLRDHYRLLLRWLHPDRSEGEQWDSALATRVNQAWNQLRTDAARAQYDAATGAGAATASTSHGSRATLPKVAAVAAPVAAEPGESRAGPIAVALLGLACVVLAWLAVNRQDPLHEELPAARPAGAAAAAAASPSAGDAAMAALSAPRTSGSTDRRAKATAQGTKLEAGLAQPEASRDEDAAVAVVAATSSAAITAPRRSVGQPDGVAATVAPERAGHAAATAATSARTPAPAPAPVAPATPAASQYDPMQLFLEAEATLHTVTSYFAAGDGPEPAWLDMPTGLEAAGARTRLRARHAGKAHRHMELTDPSWTLGSHAASVHGAYRLDRRSGPVETGMLRVELARLGQHWRVVAVQLEPAQ